MYQEEPFHDENIFNAQKILSAGYQKPIYSNQREMRKHKSNELWADDKYRQRQIDAHTGKIHGPHSDETKDKIREKMIGRKFSPETIEKMRMSAKNRKCRDGN